MWPKIGCAAWIKPGLGPTPGNGHDIGLTGRLPRIGEARALAVVPATCTALAGFPRRTRDGTKRGWIGLTLIRRPLFSRFDRAGLRGIFRHRLGVVRARRRAFQNRGRAGILSRDRQYLAD